MSELKQTIPPLFSKADLIVAGMLISLITLSLMLSRDAIELKLLKVCVAVLGLLAMKGLAVIFQVYYPRSNENQSYLPSAVFNLLLLLLMGVMTAIGTWHQGDNLKEHLYDFMVVSASVLMVLIVAAIITKKFSAPKRIK